MAETLFTRTQERNAFFERKIAEARQAEQTPGKLAAPAPPRRVVPPTHPGLSPHVNADLAVTLADLLDDHRSLRFYDQLAARVRRGDLCPGRPPAGTGRMLIAKARELRGLKKPAGPIANPAAVFVAWVRKL